MSKYERIIIGLLVFAWLYTGALACTAMYFEGNVESIVVDESWPDNVELEADITILGSSTDINSEEQ